MWYGWDDLASLFFHDDLDTPDELMGDFVFVALGGKTGYGEPDESYGFLYL